MHPAGEKLRRIRERLGLRYRDVHNATEEIAKRRGTNAFHVGLSRLSDIENKGTLPTIYRTYALAAVYKLEFRSILNWYGVDLDSLAIDAVNSHLDRTTLLETEVQRPKLAASSPNLGPRQTVYLNRLVKVWGKIPAFLMAGEPPGSSRYACIGWDDWFMHPIVRPGSLVQIDPRKRSIARGGWTDEWDRPIYLFEHRAGFRCAWCSKQNDQLVLQPHPASGLPAEVYRSSEVDVLGQVTAVAFRFDPGLALHKRSSISQG